MTLTLSQKDQEMLHGDHGPATQMAMSILARMAEVVDAKELLDIFGAHIDSTVYIGDAGLEFAERLASLGAKVTVPTTLNVSGLDEHHWREWAVPKEWARQAHRQMMAYQGMGTIPTWTCAPYQIDNQALVWSANRLGRIERYHLCQLCHRRTDGALPRSFRYLLRHHRTRAGHRPASHGKQSRAIALSPRGYSRAIAAER